MEVDMIAEGLWRWSAAHPEWKPGDDWDAEVWSVYGELPDAIVLIDPLVPDDEADRFWQALDRDVERLGLPVSVLLTCPWHERSATTVRARYGATDELPAGAEAHPVSRKEVVIWLEPYRALVSGDAVLSEPDGVRLQPKAWLDREPYPPFVAKVSELLALPVERVLASHGPPVLSDARAALEEAVAQAQSSAATAE